MQIFEFEVVLGLTLNSISAVLEVLQDIILNFGKMLINDGTQLIVVKVFINSLNGASKLPSIDIHHCTLF